MRIRATLLAALLFAPFPGSALSAPICYFLECAPELTTPVPFPAPTPTPEPPIKKTREPSQCETGDYVVVDVKWADPDGGLHIRATPDPASPVLGVIPGNAVGLDVGICQGGWCQIKYACQAGWVNAQYIALRANVLRRVVGVSPSDPDGLNLRAGPHFTYPSTAAIPYNATALTLHTCQPSPKDQSSWCLVTFDQFSGWVSGRFLSR